MGLFGKKKNVRFETITIDRETEVFRALERKGWSLCDQPYQFDLQKAPDKLRKDAMKLARDMHAELVVEVWDPIYQRMPWKGLKWAAWRRATPEEMVERRKKDESRPDYSDTMGSYDDIAKRMEQKRLKVSQQDLSSFDSSIQQAGQAPDDGEVYGSAEEDMGMRAEKFDTYSSLNPYDHQGESDDKVRARKEEKAQKAPPQADVDAPVDTEAASRGPVFEKSMEVDTGVPETDEKSDVDPLAMMMEAAGDKDTKEGPVQSQTQQQQAPPAQQAAPQPPAQTPQQQVPQQQQAPPLRQAAPQPPAQTPQQQVPQQQQAPPPRQAAPQPPAQTPQQQQAPPLRQAAPQPPAQTPQQQVPQQQQAPPPRQAAPQPPAQTTQQQVPQQQQAPPAQQTAQSPTGSRNGPREEDKDGQ